jgi:hypothetical protein
MGGIQIQRVGFIYKDLHGNFEIPCGKCQPSDKKNTAEVHCRFIFFSFPKTAILYYCTIYCTLANSRVASVFTDNI